MDKNDPRASGNALIPKTNFVIENMENISADVRTKDEAPKQPDLYAELTKLDDLRKRGILSDGEFEAQKQKLLNK